MSDDAILSEDEWTHQLFFATGTDVVRRQSARLALEMHDTALRTALDDARAEIARHHADFQCWEDMAEQRGGDSR